MMFITKCIYVAIFTFAFPLASAHQQFDININITNASKSGQEILFFHPNKLHIVNSTGYNNELIRKFKLIYPTKLWSEHGFFDDDFLEEINGHWFKFLPPKKHWHYILAGLYSMIMATGISANALVIILFVRCKSLRTPANSLVINLAVSDFLMMLKMPVFIYNSFYLGPALGSIACKIYGFVGGLTGTVSIYTLAAISLDRYYVIKFPLERRFNGVRAKICIISAWTCGSLFSTIPLLPIGLGSYVPEGYMTSCSFDYLTPNNHAKIFILVFFVAAWVVPFLLIAFCYINIVSVVVSSRQISKQDPINRESSRHIKEETKRRQELRLTVVVLLVIGLWFVAWTPYATVALLGISANENLISPLTSMIPALLCKTASCIDPFIYAVNHPKFKNEFRAVFCRKILTKKSTSRDRSVQTMHVTKSYIKDNENVIDRSDDVLEEIVNLNINENFTKYGSGGSPMFKRTDSEGTELKSNVKQTMRKSSWWNRPSFSNRPSSMRRFARTLNDRSLSKEKNVF